MGLKECHLFQQQLLNSKLHEEFLVVSPVKCHLFLLPRLRAAVLVSTFQSQLREQSPGLHW